MQLRQAARSISAAALQDRSTAACSYLILWNNLPHLMSVIPGSFRSESAFHE